MNFVEEILAKYGGDINHAIKQIEPQLKEHPVDTRLNLQVLHYVNGNEAAAYAISDELLRLAPQDPRVLFNRGWHLIRRGQFQSGFAHLENGRMLKTYGSPPLASSRPLWNPEKSRPGDTLLLTLEGGLGDEILNVRFVRELARDYKLRVVVICTPSLAPVFHRMPEVAAVAQKEACLGIYHDWWAPGMSLPLLLKVEPKTLDGKPYLKSDSARTQGLKGILDATGKGKLKIGIRWAGSPQFEHQQLRKFPPKTLLSLAGVANVQLYSLQTDNDLVTLPEGIIDLDPLIHDWDDTAAILQNMDLVISSCTSVAHMSAAIGRPTWVLVPVLPYYVWALPGSASPWYQSVRLFRQPSFGSWDLVEKDLHEAVTQLARR